MTYCNFLHETLSKMNGRNKNLTDGDIYKHTENKRDLSG